MATRKIKDRRNSATRRLNRLGTATVELAIVAPLLIVLTLGTMDICSLIFLKEAATLAAYEGARVGIEKGKTDADAKDRVIDFLISRNIIHSASACVMISDPSFEEAETLEHVTVTVTLPIEGNLIIAPQILENLELSSSVTMRKEYRNLSS